MSEETSDQTSMSRAEMLAFPDGFLWGAATAAYQYEGKSTNNQ